LKSFLFNSFDQSVGLLLLLIVTIVVIILDTSINQLFVFDSNQRSSESYLVNLVLIVLFYSAVQILVIRSSSRYIHPEMAGQQRKLRLLYRAVLLASFVQIAISATIILEMVSFSYYNTSLLFSVVLISYALSIPLLGLLIWKFLSWLRLHHNLVVLTYSIATSAFLINVLFTLLYVSNGLINEPSNITPMIDPLIIASNSSNPVISSIYSVTGILSFFAMWAGTVMLLRHYSERLGNLKYWIVVSVPVVYFVSQFQSLFLNVFDEFRLSQPFLFGTVFTLIYNSAYALGGLLFGIAFWTVARRVKRRDTKNYLFISAIGIALLFSSNHSAIAVANSPYPPFGIASVWFVGLASYFLLYGIYSSALSITRDSELRREIRKSVGNQLSLLHSIGTPEMESQIQKSVMSIYKKLPEDVEPQSSLEEEDVKQYINEVVREVKEHKIKL
jgi:hypothetical protein